MLRVSHVIIEIEQVEQLCGIEFFLFELLDVELHVGIGDGSLHLVIEAQTVANAFVQLLLRFVSDVDVLVALNAQDLRLVVNLSLHYTVSEGLGNHELHILARNVQFGGDICQRDARICEGNLTEPNADDDLIESEDDVVQAIFLEGGLVFFNGAVEVAELSLQHHLDQFVVGVNIGEDEHIRKDLSVGDFSQKQLHYDGSLLAADLEALGSVGAFSDGLVEHVQRFAILPSHCLHAASVIEVFAELVVGLSFGEGTLFDQVVGSFEVAVAQVVPEQKVEESALSDFVSPHAGAVESLEEGFPDGEIRALPLVNSGKVVVEVGGVVVQITPVRGLQSRQQFSHRSQTLLQSVILPQHLHQQNPCEALQLQRLQNAAGQVFAELEFLSEGSVEGWEGAQGRRHIDGEGFKQRGDVMGSDHSLVLPHVFGDLGDGPGLLVGHHLVEHGESVSDF